jgi:pyruvate-formate lyase-activating enzyme
LAAEAVITNGRKTLTEGIVDGIGRTIDYLRVSVTDRCNLRCVYCMPQEGIEWKPHADMLSIEETLDLCAVLGYLGIRKIKVTGGEPFLRKGCTVFVRGLKKIPEIQQITLTTNGLLLNDYIDEIADVLNGINISLDSLNGERFRKIAGDGEPEKILDIERRCIQFDLRTFISSQTEQQSARTSLLAIRNTQAALQAPKNPEQYKKHVFDDFGVKNIQDIPKMPTDAVRVFVNSQTQKLSSAEYMQLHIGGEETSDSSPMKTYFHARREALKVALKAHEMNCAKAVGLPLRDDQAK